MIVDINCDVGEGVVNEKLLFPYISSCNIACGGHFGNKESIQNTLQLAIKNKVHIGAHPSFPDKENFGRKILQISSEDLKESIENQMDLFLDCLKLFNVKMHHIKPHGALYNLISKDKKAAENFISITKKYLKNCFLYVPYNSEIAQIALKNKIQIKYEAFADRNYNDNLSLVARTHKNAIIKEPKDVFNHVCKILNSGKVTTISGLEKSIKADTFCVHGDHKNAVAILTFLHKNLQNKKFKIAK